MNLKIILIIIIACFSHHLFASNYDQLDKTIRKEFEKGDMPGISVVIIENGKQTIKTYGYADLDKREPVTKETLFEIGSCSKAFTALAVLKFAKDYHISLDSYISNYLSDFKVFYKDSVVDISINHLLHHTSGIPWHTLSLVPQGEQEDALKKTVRKINGIRLRNIPGEKFEYASINYDILGLIIAKVTGIPYEQYMYEEIFAKLNLSKTSVGVPIEKNIMSQGYKVGFFKPRKYDAPLCKGNNPAAYIISNAEDIAKWLNYQMGIFSCGYDSLISESHKRNSYVKPQNLISYSKGWNVSLRGDNEIFHDGLNPNYSSYIAFRKEEGIGVAVLTNSNCPQTAQIGQKILKILANDKTTPNNKIEDSNDKTFSVVAILLCMYLLLVLVYLGYILYGIFNGKRIYEPFTTKKIYNLGLTLLYTMPFIYGIYLLPKAMANFSWEAAIMWTPISFPIAIIICLCSIFLSYLVYFISTIFKEKNMYLRESPSLILLSMIAGLSNMVIVLLITSALSNKFELKYTLYYFGLAVTLYLAGRKTLQTKMIYLTRTIIYDLRMKLVNKVFSTSYENFEKVDKGRIYSTMNDDIGIIGDSAISFVSIMTSIITATAAFVYLATLAFWAVVITILIVGTISSIYYYTSKRTQVFFEEARETRNKYLSLLTGMIEGFKELSIRYKKKIEYKDDIEKTTNEYREKICTAHIKFINAFLIGESLLIFVLGAVSFAIPRILPGIEFYTVMSFVIILLYLIGPVKAILGSIPQIMQLRISWKRIQSFINDIPENQISVVSPLNLSNEIQINSIKANSISYTYADANDKEGFSLAPLSFEVQKGEALFIVGGNGSGKTTLAKLLTGLYTTHEGCLMINNKETDQSKIGEYFSTVFNPFHIFKKIYSVDASENSKKSILHNLLQILKLDSKVEIKNNEFSTINLSGGQRKRLALLQCYLEDKPIYLFDEWAADQDPVYRRYFYRELLPAMKQQGKIIIAITHDDHYFDVADKILKLDMGKVEYYKVSEEVEKGIFTKA